MEVLTEAGHTIYIITMRSHNTDIYTLGFSGGSDSKESTCNAGDPGLIPGSGRSAGENNGYPLQCSCLEYSMDRGPWRAPVHGVAKSGTGLNG